MDSLTQACLGAAVGGALLGRRLGRRAVLIGAALGTLPDLDVVIDYGDAVADYTYHRGFSHSLAVLGALATLLALVTARFAPRDIPFSRWWLFYAACLLTHPLLDAFTTYGTQLWWPLPTPPVSWSTIFIIDPLYTLPLLGAVIVALIRGRRAPRALHWGLALSSAYLAFSLGAKTLIEARIEPLLAERGLADAPCLIQPTPFNTLLWRVTVIDGNAHYETLVGLLDDRPPRLVRFARGAELEDAALDTASGRRLAWFADPFLRYRTRSVDGVRWLVATDLRLGFPGYYPFNFRLARDDGPGGWEAVPSRLIAGNQPDRESLLRLLERALFGEGDLALGEQIRQRPAAGAGR